MTELKDLQTELFDTVIDNLNKLVKAIIYEIWVTGELNPRLRGFEFEHNNNKYQIILEIKKESLKWLNTL